MVLGWFLFLGFYCVVFLGFYLFCLLGVPGFRRYGLLISVSPVVSNGLARFKVVIVRW